MPDQHANEIQEGHRKRFDEIFDAYFRTCLDYAYNKLQTKDASEDVVLIVFAKVYNNPLITRRLQQEEQPPLPYLKSAITNAIADWWAREAREKKHRKNLVINLPEERRYNKEEEMIRKERIEQLYKLIEKLSPQRQMVMRLTAQGYKSAKIALALKIEQQTVRNIRAQSIKLMQTDAKARGFTPWMLLLVS